MCVCVCVLMRVSMCPCVCVKSCSRKEGFQIHPVTGWGIRYKRNGNTHNPSPWSKHLLISCSGWSVVTWFEALTPMKQMTGQISALNPRPPLPKRGRFECEPRSPSSLRPICLLCHIYMTSPMLIIYIEYIYNRINIALSHASYSMACI